MSAATEYAAAQAAYLTAQAAAEEARLAAVRAGLLAWADATPGPVELSLSYDDGAPYIITGDDGPLDGLALSNLPASLLDGVDSSHDVVTVDPAALRDAVHAKDAWWITLDRQYGPTAHIGPYPTGADADHAFVHAALVDALCQEDCLDATIARHDRMPEGAVHVIDPTDPNHTGRN